MRIAEVLLRTETLDRMVHEVLSKPVPVKVMSMIYLVEPFDIGEHSISQQLSRPETLGGKKDSICKWVDWAILFID